MKRTIAICILLIASSVPVFSASNEEAQTARDGSWTGLYLGAKIGYGAILRLDSTLPSSLIGGGEVGYSYQFDSHWLVGALADFSGAKFDGSYTGSGFSNFPGQPEINFRNTQSIDWFGTVRGKFGYILVRKFLVFGTAGFAYADVENDFSATFINIIQPGYGTSNNTIDTGWCVGGGLAYALDAHWQLKGEYLRVDVKDHATESNFPNLIHTITFGIDYQF